MIKKYRDKQIIDILDRYIKQIYKYIYTYIQLYIVTTKTNLYLKRGTYHGKSYCKI